MCRGVKERQLSRVLPGMWKRSNLLQGKQRMVRNEELRRYFSAGFTLVEVLIALFIFAIVSSIIAVALRSVIDAQSGTQKSAAQFRTLEMAWVILANDFEQAVNRPIINVDGREEAAFLGSQDE